MNLPWPEILLEFDYWWNNRYLTIHLPQSQTYEELEDYYRLCLMGGEPYYYFDRSE